MKRSESIEIEAPRHRVWSIGAHQLDEIGTWSSGVYTSRALASSPDTELPGQGGRVCQTPQGETVEAFLDFDPERFAFTYEVSGDAMPGFVEHATNTWTFEALSASRTKLTMTVEMQTRGIMGTLMEPMMKMGMGKVQRTNLTDLKHFIEQGTIHPRKAKLKAP